MFFARAMYGLTYVAVAALCSRCNNSVLQWPTKLLLLKICNLQKCLERWSAALNEAGRSVLMLMKGSKIPRAELNTVQLYQHYSLFMHNKLQYTWREDYCDCVRSAQLPVLTEVRAPSLLEKHPRYVPHRDRAGYNNLSGMGGPTSSYATASLALRMIWPLKPHHYVIVEIPFGGTDSLLEGLGFATMLYSCFVIIAVLDKCFVKSSSQFRNYEDGFIFTNYIDTKIFEGRGWSYCVKWFYCTSFTVISND